MKHTETSLQAGFTIVELVMVIILIGVLSALGIGLFARSSAFSPLLAYQQLASATLQAQQGALAGNIKTSLTISQQDGEFLFKVGSDPDELPQYSMEDGGASLSVTGGLPVTISFDPLGNPVSSTNLTLAFLGESTYRICISSRGAVYQGNCQP